MRITTAWVGDPNGEAMPWLISAYDEYTADTWNGVPDFYTHEVSKADGIVREIVIEVADEAIERAFHAPVIAGVVEE